MDPKERIAALLQQSGLRNTAPRAVVLGTFFHEERALSQTEIEKLLNKKDSPDRVTIYRILKTLEEKGIIHKAPDDSGSVRYALCAEGCNEHEHFDEHVHFNCTNCGKTICLEEVPIPKVKLPKDFEVKEQQLLVKGVCGDCR